MKVIFIGAGNLATRLSTEMLERGFNIAQVYSKTEKSAKSLSLQLNCPYTTSLAAVADDADLYIFSIKDSILEEVLRAMPHRNGLWVHTAGSIPMEIFAPYVNRYGVFYPLQTFSKSREVNFQLIPFFIESKLVQDQELLEKAAWRMSQKVFYASSEQRKYLHLAAVFACNFTNHMYAIAAQLVEEHGLPFEALKPLIAETAAKIEELHPLQAQTGPAMRYDENVIERHLALLQEPRLKSLYEQLSKSIYETKTTNS